MAKQFSEEAVKRVQDIKNSYPDPVSAVMPALYIAQEEAGHLDQEAIEWVAKQVGMPPVHVMEVATFYTMYYKKPVGKYHIQICRTLSCAACGGKQLSEYVKERLGCAPHTVTDNGFWSYEEVECLGSCGSAPMLEINDRYFENLTPEKLGKLMDQIEKDKPELRYSTLKDEIGRGLSNYPMSEIIND